MRTTLNQIRKHAPCAGGWEKLLAYLGKTKADDEPLSLLTILDSNGLNDALWCLRAVEGHDKEISLYAVWCARQVQHLLTDQRSLDALDVTERYANGEATQDELAAATDAAWAAVRDARDVGSSGAAARYTAATAAAYAATTTAAAYAATTIAAAAWSAAWYAARSAAWAFTRSAAGAYAAEAAAWAKQEAELRRICEEVEG